MAIADVVHIRPPPLKYRTIPEVIPRKATTRRSKLCSNSVPAVPRFNVRPCAYVPNVRAAVMPSCTGIMSPNAIPELVTANEVTLDGTESDECRRAASTLRHFLLER